MFFLKLYEQIQYLSLNCDIKRRRGLIRDEQLHIPANKGHGYRHSLPDSTRKFVRVLINPRFGRRYSGLSHDLDGMLPSLTLLHFRPVNCQHFLDLVTHRKHRIQRRHRLLQDDRYLIPTQASALGLIQRQQIRPLEQDPPL